MLIVLLSDTLIRNGPRSSFHLTVVSKSPLTAAPILITLRPRWTILAYHKRFNRLSFQVELPSLYLKRQTQLPRFQQSQVIPTAHQHVVSTNSSVQSVTLLTEYDNQALQRFALVRCQDPADLQRRY